jgi:hypothetical protein
MKVGSQIEKRILIYILDISDSLCSVVCVLGDYCNLIV